MRAEILGAEVAFFEQVLVKKLQLSSGIIEQATEARVAVTVRAGGETATGRGSIYLSDLWAWPDPSLSHEERDARLRKRCEQIADQLRDLCGGVPAHPLELGMRLHEAVCDGGEEEMPILARAMCLSPFDAAIHDGVGQALNCSAFDFFGEPVALPSVDGLFGEGGACAAVAGLIRKPKTCLEAWWIVGPGDDLEEELTAPVQGRGYRCFKLKTKGVDSREDAERTAGVYRAVRGMGVEQPKLTVDSNEGSPDAASVLDYLEFLRTADEEAYSALQYLEQPTDRDILAHPHDWREVGRLKPVLLDEGLTRLDLLDVAADQGWSGLALKTCKGHSFTLVAAALAQQRGLSIALQDLTNPGYAAIHAALFAAHVPMLNGVELNSPQFTPQANQPWLPRLSSLFEPVHGFHRLPDPSPLASGRGFD